MRPAINVGISVSRVGGNAQIGPMKKVAGRIKLELSQYRDLEAFAQFGSDLDADTQRTLARGERLVTTLNQHERAPLAVEDQTVQIFAATNGYLDRLNVDRVTEFLLGITERLHSQHPELREKINGGDWSDETQKEVRDAVEAFAGDFGYDLDEEGQPLEDDEPPPTQPATAEPAPAEKGPRRPSAGRRANAMASQRDVKNRIASVKNIQKITRAMEMVAAARLRRAEQRIAALRPYADAIGPDDAPGGAGGRRGGRGCRCSQSTSPETNVGLLLVTGDRGLAGGFNSQIIRAGVRSPPSWPRRGCRSSWYATGRRGVSSLTFRGHELSGSYTGFADRPAYADARTIADDLIGAYIDGRVDRVEMVYNAYVSPLTQNVTRQRLLPLSRATIAGERAGPPGCAWPEHDAQKDRPARARRLRAGPRGDPQAPGARLRRDLDLPSARGVRPPASSAPR